MFGGDLAWGPMPAETVDRIRSLDALLIRGNADRDLGDAWLVDQLGPERVEWLRSLPEQLQLDVTGLGRVLFCHGSPRRDDEMIFETRSDEDLREILAGVEADVVVCGHTHMQFDRRVGDVRVVNAGSVGLGYGGPPGAYWVELGGDITPRHTPFDPSPLGASTWPRSAEVLSWIESPPPKEEVLAELEARLATLDK